MGNAKQNVLVGWEESSMSELPLTA